MDFTEVSSFQVLQDVIGDFFSDSQAFSLKIPPEMPSWDISRSSF